VTVAASGVVSLPTPSVGRTAVITGMTSGASYTVYMATEDISPWGTGSNLGFSPYLSYATSSVYVDTVPPTATVSTTNLTATSVSVGAQSNELGSVYYVMVARGSTAPTSAQVKSGFDSTGTAALKSGTITIGVINTTNYSVVNGLTELTGYDVYAVGEDTAASPNLQATPVTTAITTLDGTAPTAERPW